MTLFSFYNIAPFLSALLFLSLGTFVYLNNKKSKINKIFLFVCISTFLWQFSWFLLFSLDEKYLIEIIIKFGWIGILFIPVAFYSFITYFLKIKNLINKVILIVSYVVVGVLILFLLFSNLFINGYYEFFWGYYPKAGILHPIFLFFLLVLVLRIFYLIIYYIKKSKEKIKVSQLKFIFIALLFYAFSSLDFIVNYGYEFYPIGFIFIIAFLMIISYTIIRHRLMDVKLVLRKSTVVLASLAVVFGFATLVKILAERFSLIFDFWVDLLVLAVGIFTYPYVRDYFFKLANKYFFSSLYDSRKVILETTSKIRTFLDAKKIYEFLDETFADIFHTRKFGVLDLDEDNNCYVVNYNSGFNLGNRKKFAENDVLHKMFIKKNKTIILEEAKELYYNKKTKDTIDLMEKLGVELLVPLNIKKRTVGLLVLGPKETKEMYNDEDLQVLEIIGGQAAVSIENAQLYGEVKNFNRRLKKEIKEATADLEKTNKELRTANVRLSEAYKKLRQLDDAKNEFISIASHQLRTPLTSIKGFLSMILQGDFGKYSSSVEDALRKIYISNERLIKLVNDLLSISRIEAGRFVFNLNENNIKDLISKTVETFELEAKNKKLDLRVDLPKEEVEPFVFDKEKIQEVVSNLVDNAIKYTQEGEVKIKLENLKDKARITVSDSGRGMLKSELDSVFEKFRRGKKSNNLNTEGTGLGLYVCEKIISAHQGKIWAESDGMGKGSRFIVEIPKSLKTGKKEEKRSTKKES
jgi:signal transduction histidine kinase